MRFTAFLKLLGLMVSTLLALCSFSLGVENFSNLPPCPGSRITDALVDSSGILWASTQGEGLFYLELDKNVWKRQEQRQIFQILKISMPWLKMPREEYGWEQTVGECVFGMANNGKHTPVRRHCRVAVF